jgi:hypothetical protein
VPGEIGGENACIEVREPQEVEDVLEKLKVITQVSQRKMRMKEEENANTRD